MSMVVLATMAWAAPVFTGDPGDVRLAELAWQGARECTGRDGLAVDQVEIVRKTVPLDYLGVARTDPAGRLYRIELNSDPRRLPEVVVHEVSHAWVSEGPVALVEGAAELLADCIVAHRPGLAPLQYDDGTDLSGLPDLRTWAKPSDDAPSELHVVRTDGYVGAARLLRTAQLAIDPTRLWSDAKLDWDEFDAALTGPRGEQLRAALDGGAEAQRIALRDDDRDGLTALAEAWLGTDDHRFDTDGDGWGDAARLGVPAGAIPAPPDGSPICTGIGATGAPSGVTLGGNLRGIGVPDLVVERAGGDGARPVLARLSAPPGTDTTGAAWVVATGTPAGGGCASTAWATVWSDDAALDRAVEPVMAAIASTGAGDELRVAVALGGAHTRVDPDGVVRWSTAEVAQAEAQGTLAHLAHVSVAVHRLWLDGDRDWAAAEAVARSMER